MKQSIDGCATVKVNGFGHFPQAEAQQIGDSLQAVLDRVLVQIKCLRRAGHAAIAVQKVDTGCMEQVLILPVRLQRRQGQGTLKGSGLAFIDPLSA